MKGALKERALFILKGGSLLLLFLIPLKELKAQGDSELRIQDEEGLPFLLRFDGEWIENEKGEEASDRVELDSIEAGMHRILVRYPDTGIAELEEELHIGKGVTRSYSLQERGGGRELTLISESRIRRKSEENGEGRAQKAPPEEENIPAADSARIASYQGKKGCERPLGRETFRPMLKKVSESTFEKERIRKAKKKLAGNCLLSAQVAALMETLDYEDNRLDLAKYAYGKTFDQDNYHEVRKALNFKSSKKELEQYLQEAR